LGQGPGVVAAVAGDALEGRLQFIPAEQSAAQHTAEETLGGGRWVRELAGRHHEARSRDNRAWTKAFLRRGERRDRTNACLSLYRAWAGRTREESCFALPGSLLGGVTEAQEGEGGGEVGVALAEGLVALVEETAVGALALLEGLEQLLAPVVLGPFGVL